MPWVIEDAPKTKGWVIDGEGLPPGDQERREFGPTPLPHPQGKEVFRPPALAGLPHAALSAIEGGTLGLSPHAIAGLRSATNKVMGGNRSYAQELEDYRKWQDQGARDFPGMQGAAELAGGMATGGALGKQIVKQISKKAAPGLLKTAGALSAGGAAEGAVYGAAKNDEDRLSGAGWGTLIGATAPLLFAGGGLGARKLLGKKPTPLPPMREADEVLGGIAAAEGISPGMATRAGELGREGTILADAMGPTGEGLLRRTAVESPEVAQGLMGTILKDGGRVAPARVAKDVASIAGMPKTPMLRRMEKVTGDSVESAEGLLKKKVGERTAEANKNWGKIGDEAVTFTPELLKRMKSANGAKAINEAIDIAVTDGDKVLAKALRKLKAKGSRKPGPNELSEVIPVVGSDPPAGGAKKAAKAVTLTVKEADKVRRALSNIAKGDKYVDNVTGNRTPVGVSLGKLNRDFTKSLTAKSDELGVALKDFSSASEVMDAVSLGDNFLKWKVEAITGAMEGMSDAAKKAYRARALVMIADKSTSSAEGASGVFKFLINPKMDRKLEAVFGKDKAAKISRIARETEADHMLRTAGQGGTAPTAKLLGSDKRAKIEGVIGKEKTSLLDNLVDRNEAFTRTERAAREGVSARGSRAAEVVEAREGGNLWDAVKGGGYLNKGVLIGKAAGAGVDALVNKLKGLSPETVAEVGKILGTSGGDVQKVIYRIKKANINAVEKAALLAEARRIYAGKAGLGGTAGLMGAVTGERRK